MYHRRLYAWTLRQAERRHALVSLGTISFVESSFFPIPPDILMVPIILANRARAWLTASVATVTSVLGGLFGYLIGYLFFDTVGITIIETLGKQDQFAEFQTLYQDWGAWIVFIAGVTPFPYKVVTVASGVVVLDLVVFTIASVLARGLRFFLVAALLWWFGPVIRDFLDKRLGWVLTAFVVLLLGGFLVI